MKLSFPQNLVTGTSVSCPSESPAVNANLMTDIMRLLLWNAVTVYLDDIINGGSNFREDYNLLKDV